jgi:hypothetical protein
MNSGLAIDPNVLIGITVLTTANNSVLHGSSATEQWLKASVNLTSGQTIPLTIDGPSFGRLAIDDILA